MEKKPFNDADAQYQKHVGTPSSYNMKQIPKPIRIIGYFMIGFMAIAAAFIILAIMLDKVL
ncbi:amino acid transporter [Solibacillus silvestris]|uniref:amino acid transporter n=1 Tax=Solibacillus silvestris TaxID=76853 RepID=UPI003F81EEFB